MSNVISQHIEITPGVCGGKPRIAGHRIRVEDIVIWNERMGLSPDEIVSQYPTITLADVYAALAYYHDHFEEISRQIREDEAFAREMQKKTPSLVQQKLTQQNGPGNSISGLAVDVEGGAAVSPLRRVASSPRAPNSIDRYPIRSFLISTMTNSPASSAGWG